MSQEAVERMQEDARKWREYQKSLEPILLKENIVDLTEPVVVRGQSERLSSREEQRVSIALSLEGEQGRLDKLLRLPKVGKIVLYTFPNPFDSSYPLPKGQTQQVPAIITNVFTDSIVNLTVFIDGSCVPMHVTSIALKTNQRIIDGTAYWQWVDNG